MTMRASFVIFCNNKNNRKYFLIYQWSSDVQVIIILLLLLLLSSSVFFSLQSIDAIKQTMRSYIQIFFGIHFVCQLKLDCKGWLCKIKIKLAITTTHWINTYTLKSIHWALSATLMNQLIEDVAVVVDIFFFGCCSHTHNIFIALAAHCCCKSISPLHCYAFHSHDSAEATGEHFIINFQFNGINSTAIIKAL